MITIAQQGTWLPADTQTPISLYLALVRDKHGFLLESSEVDGRLGRYSLIGWDFRLILSCVNGNLEVQSFDPRLHDLKRYSGQGYIQGLRSCLDNVCITAPENLGALPAVTRSICGYLAYNMGGIFEPALADKLPPASGQSTFVLPGKIIVFDHLHHRCCYLTLDSTAQLNGCQRISPPAQPVVGAITIQPEHEQFVRQVERAKDYIAQGEAIQIVLSTRFSAPFSGSPFELYRRLRQINPSPYTFFMHFEEQTLMGSSPELLIRCEDGLLQLRPIAGTRVRGVTEAEDQQLAHDLVHDKKECAEHAMLVDLGRMDLARIAEPESVRVDKYMQVERFSHVMHLTSYLSAGLAKGLDALDVLRAGFPAGTVSGAPKIRAMQIIADEEKMDRGPYAGGIGWIGLDKGQVNLDMGITIRSLWVKNGTVHWQAGAGLIAESDPEKEWQECHNKARAILKAITSTGAGDEFVHRTL
ncbi:MAG: anthranilate synthase component I family protein [Desulfovibrionales bacterium]|nr:anthranilate synthase component I family protein [Desulfovibrionales bacterium]